MTVPLPEDVQATFAATLVDEWVRGGLGVAVVCPGSRSTPLALALADHPGVALEVQHDERSGGFLALGAALASGRPSLVLVTSGTATAELHPAVVEAGHAAVPLLVCTADRPPELRDVGAPQTIDQTHLFGRAVRWFADPGVADAAVAPRWRAFAARALAEATGPPAGPVHLNLPFREPLVGTPGPLPPGRNGERPWTTTSPPQAGSLPAERRSAARGVANGGPATAGGGAAATVAAEGVDLRSLAGRRGLILAGHPSGPAEPLVRVAEALGWPVVADPRAAAWGSGSQALVAHLDGILRDERARDLLRPEVVLRLGGIAASRVVNEWIAASGAEEVVVPGPGWSATGWSDPAGTAATVVTAPGGPAGVTTGLARQLDTAGAPAERVPGWRERWRAVADAAADAVRATLPRLAGPSGLHEPGVAHDLVAALPGGSQLVVSSSMPIRDVERYAAPRPGLRVLANRGANGIDGVVSTAVGAAVAAAAAVDGAGDVGGTGGVTGLLVGDLAFLHDSNGLLGIAGRLVDLVCVVVDNDGGGIFSFLPQARRLPAARFERLFGTPHGLDLVALARAYGVPARSVDQPGDLAPAVGAAASAGGVHVLVVRTDRDANVEAHRRLDDTIATAVAAALAAVELDGA